MRRIFSCVIYLLISNPYIVASVHAQTKTEKPSAVSDEGIPNVTLGKEYSGYRKARNQKNGAYSGAKSDESTLEKILLFIPNRFLDLIDIFKVDVGVGPAFGAVARITKYGQAGYRSMEPASLRAGLMGRDWPVMLEHSSEFGIGPTFIDSKDREIGVGEVGAGVDLFIAGAYLGIDLAEIPDFFAGWLGFDLSKDDLK